MASPELQRIFEHYNAGGERERLSSPRGLLEFERSKEVIRRVLPPPGSTVADIGGGPGHYALWLADLGYKVIHRDLVPLHVELISRANRADARIETGVADARSLDLDDASVDAVLLLGPIYHLERRSDRLQALAESRRVVRSGGPVFVAAISRWAARVDGVLRKRLYETFPEVEVELESVERTGRMPPLFPGSFGGYCHRPGQLLREVKRAMLEVVDLVAVEGPAFWLADLDNRMADDVARRVVFETARALERVPELLGASPHLLITAIRPTTAT